MAVAKTFMLTNRWWWQRGMAGRDDYYPSCRRQGCVSEGMWNARYQDEYGCGRQSFYWCSKHLPNKYLAALAALIKAAQTAASLAMKEKTMHTPGPWTIHPNDHYKVVDAKGIIVADVQEWPDADNIHLIAAAPALLEALERLLAYNLPKEHQGGCPTHSQDVGCTCGSAEARAAIDAAKETA